MSRVTPLIRISVGLVAMTCTILLTADLLGLLPREENQRFEERIRFCERLAAHAVNGRSRSDLAALRRTFELSAKRDADLISAGLRDPEGRVILASSAHRDHWRPTSAEGSTATHMRVPLFDGKRPWATLEVRFKDAEPQGLLAALWGTTLIPILAFVMTTGSIVYFLYMRRTLQHLDPSSVVPTRVQMALDVMAEGVVLIDANERIVLANASFIDHVDIPRTTLLGTVLRDIEWRHKNAPGIALPLPWEKVLSDGKQSTGSEMTLLRKGEERVFGVNASPVLDGWDKPKGAIVTFDDVTELARRTAELERSNVLLEKTREEVELRNQELEELAKRDPLTGVSNRRAFLEALEGKLEAAQRGESSFSCVMADIDEFKQINDEHGHSMGDEIIRQVADALGAGVRSSDFVCRWGGEEFILFVDGGIEPATAAATRLRKRIDSPGFARVPVTVSFGVATVASEIRTVQELIDRADAALYASKESGRNRVTRWDEMDHGESAHEAGTP